MISIKKYILIRPGFCHLPYLAISIILKFNSYINSKMHRIRAQNLFVFRLEYLLNILNFKDIYNLMEGSKLRPETC